VNVTCLELNEASATMARDIIESLGLSDRVKVVCTDATTYKHEKPVDLFISETMYAGLTEEPQIQIMRNIVPQVKNEGIVIPEWIAVDAALMPIGTMDRKRLQEVKRFTRDDLSGGVDFVLDVPEDSVSSLVLSCRVGIFDTLELGGRDSCITRPTDIQILYLNKGKTVSVNYEPGTNLLDVSIDVK
jgi:hypothetical protein